MEARPSEFQSQRAVSRLVSRETIGTSIASLPFHDAHSVVDSKMNQVNKPLPPSRRPNIKERTSMLEMAKQHHSNRKPKGGFPLPGLTNEGYEEMDKSRIAVHDLQSETKPGKSRFVFWKKRTKPTEMIRLLDENEQ